MIRVAQKLGKTSAIAIGTNRIGRILLPQIPSLSSRSLVRFYGTNGSNAVDPVALQMINYALGLARTQKSSESYAQALLVMEQCLSANERQGADNSSETTRGVALLAMSNLLSERGDFNEAMDKLESIQDLSNSSLGIRVAAMEGLIGLNLEMGQDVTSSMLADKCLQLLENNPEDGGSGSSKFNVLKSRAKAVKGLVHLVLGDLETAGKCFAGSQEDKDISGNIALSHGELLHSTGNFALAKEFYQKAIQGVPETECFDDPYGLAACNMVSTEVLLGSTCALGQLEAHSGNFHDAEEILTRALAKAEEHFGLHHPKVGVILTCIALMFRDKARLEHTSSILIQEGLYRRAIDLLKAPPLETEDSELKVERRDIVALARGGYAEILSVQQNRKGEGERMRKWAETAWRNRRLSLAEALEISEPSKIAIVDSRTSRVL